MCIEIDYEDTIPSSIEVDIGDGQVAKIAVVVPWLPERCSSCQAFGHNCQLKAKAILETSKHIQQDVQMEPSEGANTSAVKSVALADSNEDDQTSKINSVAIEEHSEGDYIAEAKSIEATPNSKEEAESEPAHSSPSHFNSPQAGVQESKMASLECSNKENDLDLALPISHLCAKSSSKPKQASIDKKTTKETYKGKKNKKRGKGQQALPSSS